MEPDNNPPKFFSLDFHARFFPSVIMDRLNFKKSDGRGTTFTSTTEMFITLAVCVILAIIGLPSAANGSVLGWTLSVLGVGGTIVLLILSVIGNQGERPSYNDFLIGVFLFFVVLGAFIGIPAGMETHSFLLGLLVSLAGLAAGYVIGILGGIWLQYLGWIAVVINMIAGFGAIIMSGTVLIMLAALAF